MKFFVSIFLVFLGSYSMNAQSISLNAMYSELSGPNIEIGYKQLMTNRMGISGRAAYWPNTNSYGYRGGLFYRFMKTKHFDIDLGAEYSFSHIKSNISETEIKSHNIEIPLSVNVRLNDHYYITGGLSSRLHLKHNKKFKVIGKNQAISNIRLGIQYRW